MPTRSLDPTDLHIEVMRALAAGEQPAVLHTRPRVRITMVERGWIVATGPRTPPSDHKRSNPPRRPYQLTELGRQLLAQYTQPSEVAS